MAKSLENDLETLPNLDRETLVSKWHSIYGSAPPIGISKQLLIQSISYRMQEMEYGGLKPATKRILEKIASRQSTIPMSAQINPGMRLLRDWHGVTYEAIITDNGVKCNGKTYSSLSELARTITGTAWSGPLFFGLKKGKKS